MDAFLMVKMKDRSNLRASSSTRRKGRRKNAGERKARMTTQRRSEGDVSPANGGMLQCAIYCAIEALEPSITSK